MVETIKRRGGSRLAFIDLFAGPGSYKDEVPSTPLHVLGNAAKDPDLREMLVAVFNDVHRPYVTSLQNKIDSTPEFKQFRHQPRVWNYQVGDDLVDELAETKLVPTLLFVDPFGYKGLSLRLINSVLKDWGSDCIIFFNYNRINPGINNPAVKEHMDALFGDERAEKLRDRLGLLPAHERERVILEEIADAFKEMQGSYFLSFRFRKETEKRISHHILFVTKHFRGYHLMKEMMAKESSAADQGEPSYEYNPALKNEQALQFELSRPLDELEDQLLNDFAGRTLIMKEIYEQHSIGKPFLSKNYKQALINLESRGEIEGRSSKRRKKNTFADNVFAVFPARSE